MLIRRKKSLIYKTVGVKMPVDILILSRTIYEGEERQSSLARHSKTFSRRVSNGQQEKIETQWTTRTHKTIICTDDGT